MAIYFGFNPPFIGGKENVLSRQEDDRLIKNDVMQLLLTVPGERVNRPNFGTPLRSTVFEPGDESTLNMLRIDILQALSEQEPRIYVRNLDLTTFDDTTGIFVKLVFHLIENPKVELSIERFINTPNGGNI